MLPRMWTNIFCLAFAANLAAKTRAQTITVTARPDDEDDSGPNAPRALQRNNPYTCGYINNDPNLAVTCAPSSCGILNVPGWDTAYIGCCESHGCHVPTTCIESGTPSGPFTTACTDGSLSRCATLIWPDLSAEAYACVTSRATLTVATEASGTTTREVVFVTKTRFDESDDKPKPPWEDDDGIDWDNKDAGDDDDDRDDDGDDGDGDDGGPGMGWEHDLDSRQRIGAGIGSGVTGGLLLIFFGIFGCWRGPARGEPHRNPQRQDTMQPEVHLPGEKAAMKRTVADGPTMEETQPSASWTPSPIDIQSPQPLRPQPPYYSTSDIPGSSMENRNPQHQ